MNMRTTIEKLFFDFQQTDEYIKAYNDMPRLKELQAAQDTFVCPAFERSFEEGNKLDCILTGALDAAQDFGFVLGFKYAMRLRDECTR